MLAALGLRDGLDLSYACATRGEGGQNDIGTETTEALGTLRSAEMERAAAVLDLRLYWLSTSPDDSIVDFGFSKSGIETLHKWGHARTLQRFVEIVRRERPDILCQTFLDIPGQHGHHRAMTQAAHEVMTLSADSAYVIDGLQPWQPKKLYLPAWGGGGTAYDDELPPPPATLLVQARGVEPVTGWSFEHIAQHSRRYHLTQGMGRWISPGNERDWPLHLAWTVFDKAEFRLTDHLPTNLAELARYADAHVLARPLARAQAAIDEAQLRFADFPAVLSAASRALSAVQEAKAQCPAHAADEVQHRLVRKIAQLSRVIRLAAGVDVRGYLENDHLRPGDTTRLVIETHLTSSGTTGSGRTDAADADADADADAKTVSARKDGPDRVTVDVRLTDAPGYRLDGENLTLTADAPVFDPCPDSWLPDAPRAPAIAITLDVDGQRSETVVALETPPVVLCTHNARLTPDTVLLNTLGASRRFNVTLDDQHPASALPTLSLPEGWSAVPADHGFTVQAPLELADGLYEIPLLLDSEPACFEHRITYPHIDPRLRSLPACVRVRAVRIGLPDVRLGYVGGGSDRVSHWLTAMGLPVRELEDSELAQDDTFAQIDTLVIGLFAMRSRPALRKSMPAIHRWIERGGHLLTLYHRPWDAWDPDTVPPRRLEIGQPSLRYRVTDEQAKITVLQAGHPLLNFPNVIAADDWAGWHKERGLYFARSWDAAYLPLLSMSDPDEEPHHGALLSADIGRGRHVHTSLIVHHQAEQLVPGAFRLLANFVA